MISKLHYDKDHLRCLLKCRYFGFALRVHVFGRSRKVECRNLHFKSIPGHSLLEWKAINLRGEKGKEHICSSHWHTLENVLIMPIKDPWGWFFLAPLRINRCQPTLNREGHSAVNSMKTLKSIKLYRQGLNCFFFGTIAINRHVFVSLESLLFSQIQAYFHEYVAFVSSFSLDVLQAC